MTENDFIKIEGEVVSGNLNEIDPNKVIGSAENVVYQLKLERMNDKRCRIFLINAFNDEVLGIEENIKIENIWKSIMKKETKTKPAGLIYSALIDIFQGEPLPLPIIQRIRAIITKTINVWNIRKFGKTEEEKIDDTSAIDFQFKDEIETEAEKILSHPSPIVLIEKHLDNLIAGERSNKLLIFNLAITGKCKNPEKKTIICAKHEAGAGKTWILKTIASFYKSHTVSHLTKRALNYMGQQLNEKEILFIKELGRLDQENDSYGNASIKMLSVEDEGLVTTYTVKDPDTGRYTTETIKTDPITVFTSTTRRDIDAQFVRRYWIFSPDGSVEQTRRIEKFKVWRNNQENDVLLGVKAYTDYDYSKEVLTCLVNHIEDVDVLISFYKSVFSILDKSKLRIRGDYDKIKLLLQMYGVLNCRTLPRINLNNKIVYILTPEKAIEILQIARESLIYMAKDVEGRDYDLVKVFRELKLRPPTNDDAGTPINPSMQIRIADQLKKSRGTVLKWLKDFEGRGYIMETNFRPKIYELKKTVEEIETDLSGYSVLKDEDELNKLKQRMVEEGNEYFKSRGINFQFSDIKVDNYVEQD